MREIRFRMIAAILEDKLNPERFDHDKDSSRFDPVFTSGMFIQKSALSFFKQASENLGGITVEVLGETPAKQRLPRWYKFKEDGATVRVTREDGVRDLQMFWEEVNRLKAEAEQTT